MLYIFLRLRSKLATNFVGRNPRCQSVTRYSLQLSSCTGSLTYNDLYIYNLPAIFRYHSLLIDINMVSCYYCEMIQ